MKLCIMMKFGFIALALLCDLFYGIARWTCAVVVYALVRSHCVHIVENRLQLNSAEPAIKQSLLIASHLRSAFTVQSKMRGAHAECIKRWKQSTAHHSHQHRHQVQFQ